MFLSDTKPGLEKWSLLVGLAPISYKVHDSALPIYALMWIAAIKRHGTRLMGAFLGGAMVNFAFLVLWGLDHSFIGLSLGHFLQLRQMLLMSQLRSKKLLIRSKSSNRSSNLPLQSGRPLSVLLL
jgi:hypothetical protein